MIPWGAMCWPEEKGIATSAIPFSPVHRGSSQKEFSAAHQTCRPSQKNIFAFGANRLRSAGRVYFHGRLCVAGSNRGHGRGAGPSTGGKRFSHSALQEADLGIMLSMDQD